MFVGAKAGILSQNIFSKPNVLYMHSIVSSYKLEMELKETLRFNIKKCLSYRSCIGGIIQINMIEDSRTFQKFQIQE